MALFKKNETKNVSSTKGVKGGYIFVAPAGTTLPTDIKTNLAEAFLNLGFISEDGYTESEETDANELKDMNGDLMDSATTSRVESAKLTLAEIKAQTLKVMYGAENVTDLDGVITVEHNGNKDEAWSIVLELVLKNGRRWRKVVPSARSPGVRSRSSTWSIATETPATTTSSRPKPPAPRRNADDRDQVFRRRR